MAAQACVLERATHTHRVRMHLLASIRPVWHVVCKLHELLHQYASKNTVSPTKKGTERTVQKLTYHNTQNRHRSGASHPSKQNRHPKPVSQPFNQQTKPSRPAQPSSQTDRQTNPISFAPCQPKIRHRPMFSIPKWKPSSRTKGRKGGSGGGKRNFKLCWRRKS